MVKPEGVIAKFCCAKKQNKQNIQGSTTRKWPFDVTLEIEYPT